MIEINQELLDFIDRLKPKYKLGIISNLFYSRKLVDEAVHIYDQFDFTILSCVEKVKKPDSIIYRLATNKAGCAINECLFIDDSRTCLEGAKSVGMSSILYVDNVKLFADLRNFGISTDA